GAVAGDQEGDSHHEVVSCGGGGAAASATTGEVWRGLQPLYTSPVVDSVFDDLEHDLQRHGALAEALLERVDDFGENPTLEHKAPPVLGQPGLVVHTVENAAPEAAPAHHAPAGRRNIRLLDILIVVEAKERAGLALLHEGVALDLFESTNAL